MPSCSYTRRVQILVGPLAVAAVLFGLGSGVGLGEGANDREAGSKPASPKNVIVLISDGCGFNHVDGNRSQGGGVFSKKLIWT